MLTFLKVPIADVSCVLFWGNRKCDVCFLLPDGVADSDYRFLIAPNNIKMLLIRHSVITQEKITTMLQTGTGVKFALTVDLFYVDQDRRPVVKPETSGSRPSTPSSQQSSSDASSKGSIDFVNVALCFDACCLFLDGAEMIQVTPNLREMIFIVFPCSMCSGFCH